MEDYWAGELMPEARALLVEIFPDAAEALVAQQAYFEALTLVSRHRDLLAQANISYDFLFDLAKSYSSAGFLSQAAETYLYILDFEEEKARKAAAYLPLIRLCHEQKQYDRVLRYGSAYLSLYPEGKDRADVTYYYADVLLQREKLEGLAGLLDEKNRPRTPKLDYLAGKLFLRTGRTDLAEFYLTWASDPQRKGGNPGYRLKLGEMLFADQEYEKAVPVYRSLLEEPQFAAHAGCRLIQMYFETGRRREALKLYQRLAEKEIEGRWLQLASETVAIEKMQ
ncbi:MAG TPA: tetratricopeptide repeat protein [Desulfosalsimonadaceae bacterium]|nr:tetratricopeptide repeat protein [Desulfosalsimonadaceae bacterium]